jgi:hypothetical protein
MSHLFASPARIVTVRGLPHYPRATAISALIMTAACSRTDTHQTDPLPAGVMMPVFMDAAAAETPPEKPNASDAMSEAGRDAGRDAANDGKPRHVVHPAGGMPLTHEER